MLIAGGTETGLNDVWATADGGRTWEERTPAAAWAPRLYVGLATLGVGTVLVGGQSDKTHLFRPYTDAWATEDGGRTWQQLPDPPAGMPGRGGMGLLPTKDGRSLVVLGGNSELLPHKDYNDEWSLTIGGAKSG